MSKCKSFDSLMQLHDQWLPLYHIGLTEKDLRHLPPFASPPFLGNSDIVPIETPHQLFLEGEELHHCVFTRREEILFDKCYIYKVLYPESGTVEVLIYDNGYELGEFQLPYNKNLPSRILLNMYKSGLVRRLKKKAKDFEAVRLTIASSCSMRTIYTREKLASTN
jgi:hypothetical protein